MQPKHNKMAVSKLYHSKIRPDL